MGPIGTFFAQAARRAGGSAVGPLGPSAGPFGRVAETFGILRRCHPGGCMKT
jgi:hypothetical protein